MQEHQATEDVRQQLHFALDACDLGTWNLDPQTMVFQCNEKTKEIFGLPQAFQVNLQTAVDVIHPDDRLKVQTAINAAFDAQSGGRYSVEYTVVHPVNGSHSIVSAKGKAYFDENGKPVKFTGTLQDITGERLASLRKEKLQQLVERSKDFMAMATLDGQMTYLNAAGRALVGVDAAADMSTLEIKDFYSDDQLRIIINEIIPALQEAGRWSGFISIRHLQTGEEIPCHGDYMLIRDPVSGHIISRGLTLRDLRPQLQAQQELEKSEKRFRNLVQEAPVATAIYTGREMQIPWANDAMIKLWGKDKSVIGLTVRQALPELEGQPFHHLLDQVFTTGQMYQAAEDEGELVVNGQLQTFYFNFSYKPLRDAAGEVYGVLNMAIDVTEQVKTKRRLEESEKNFRNLIMQAPVGICLLTGEDNHFEIANEEYLQLIGRKLEEIQHKPVWEALPEAKEQGFDVLLNNVKITGQPYVGHEQQLLLLRNGQSETVYINFVYEPLFDENKNVHSILAIAINITQQVKARHAIEDAEERARLAVESAKLGTYELNLLSGEMIGSLRFNELFDIDPDHLHPDYVSKIHADDQEIRRLAHEEARKTGRLQ
jgi:PAS domain S-box-containing protein